ncbi:hypothetical protein GCM10023206_00820 [Acinetobacter puyangensis]
MFLVTVACTHLSNASDIEIYQDATRGTVTLMLAIDTSRSMEEADDAKTTADDYELGSACYFGTYQGAGTTITRDNGDLKIQNDRTVYSEIKTRGGVSYTRKYCQVAYATASTSAYEKNKDRCEVLANQGGIKCYDRLTRVKDGLFDLLLGSEDGSIAPISDDKVIGLSHFAVIPRGDSATGTFANNASPAKFTRGGMIAVPARPLKEIVAGKTQRRILLEGIAHLHIDGKGGTPSAALYAETAAYLLGTSTLTSGLTGQENFRWNAATGRWQRCISWNPISVNGLKSCSSVLGWWDFSLADLKYQRGAYSSNAKQTSTKDFYLNETFRPTKYADGNDYYIGLNHEVSSGFFNSVLESKYGAAYQRPSSITEQIGKSDEIKACHGQGIYFLTDGAASIASDTENISKAALGPSYASGFSCNSSDKFDCSDKLTTRLLTASQNPVGLSFRTAIIGFGKDFEHISSYDGTPLIAGAKNADGTIVTEEQASTNVNNNIAAIDHASVGTDFKNTAKWGMNGRGGWYSGSRSADVVYSINAFLSTIEVNIPTMVTGSPTIPADALNPLRLQPYAYYAAFEPKPQAPYRLWTGDLNKYHVHHGELYNRSKSLRLIQANGALNTAANGIWVNGMKGQLSLGMSTTDAVQTANRKILTNRQINSSGSTYNANAAASLQPVNINSLFGEGEGAAFKNDPDKNYWLNLLGYNVSVTGTATSLAHLTEKPELRQVGAILHSSPILLTQQGKVTVDSYGDLDTSNRDDYLLFGSTQGLLHVLDADHGQEVFAFAPHEMMQRQKQAFLAENSSTGGKNKLFYGIDAPWTAYTQYVAKSDGTLTVRDSGRKIDSTDDHSSNLKGLQWVYGGLRMGGRSYYALDLSNINSPSLKFHIDPDGATLGTPLSYMGQSWSKPTIARVNWGGEAKLVMFVGGGYDAEGLTALCNLTTTTWDTLKSVVNHAGGLLGGLLNASTPPADPTTLDLSALVRNNLFDFQGYECSKYLQVNKKGAGVYMFDADTGDLLWWASDNVTASTSATTNSGTIATKHHDLKYSVVSQINAIDRNNDGLVDHLYFGDLGGQVFRVDIDNTVTTTGGFAKRIELLFQSNLVTEGLTNLNLPFVANPRFYDMPSISIHQGGSGVFAVVALSSGNRSSPLAAGLDATNRDALYVLYDHDVARNDLYANDYVRRNPDAKLAVPAPVGSGLVTLTARNFVENLTGIDIEEIQLVGDKAPRLGWKYYYDGAGGAPSSLNELQTLMPGRYKGMNGLYALDHMLYVNVYDRDGIGILGSCGAGVTGDSYLYQFCLPYGRCPFDTPKAAFGLLEYPYKAKIGAGILGATLGSAGDDQFKNIVRSDTACDAVDVKGNKLNKNRPECQVFKTTVGLQHLRWYQIR